MCNIAAMPGIIVDWKNNSQLFRADGWAAHHPKLEEQAAVRLEFEGMVRATTACPKGYFQNQLDQQ
jgi:hypothetical protein